MYDGHLLSSAIVIFIVDRLNDGGSCWVLNLCPGALVTSLVSYQWLAWSALYRRPWESLTVPTACEVIFLECVDVCDVDGWRYLLCGILK